MGATTAPPLEPFPLDVVACEEELFLPIIDEDEEEEEEEEEEDEVCC
jgi:hypothetical protein